MSSFGFRMMRLEKKLDLEKLNSRYLSFRALAAVCDDWPALLRVLFLGGHTHAALHDHSGNRLHLEIDGGNVRKVFALARALGNSTRYEFTSEMINLRFDKHKESFKLGEILSGDYAAFEYFMGICWLEGFNAELRPENDLHYRVTLDDLTWLVRKNHLGDCYAGPCLSRVFEPYEYRSWFQEILAHGDYFIDVGANVGGYAVRAAKLGASVIALEPDSENFSLLMKNLALNDCPTVQPLNVAAGSSERTAPLYAPDEAGHSYSLVERGKMREYVQVKPLDQVISRAIGEPKIQLTKIDVEGNELDVILGATHVLKNTRYLMVEMWPRNRETLLNSLKKLDFKLVDVGRTWGLTNELNLLFKKT